MSKTKTKTEGVAKGAQLPMAANAMTGNGVDGQVPLNQLRRSDSNVRKTRIGKDLKSIPELAELIGGYGLLARLAVVESPEGGYEVVAGGRRLEALKLLAEQGRIRADEPIDCRLFPNEEAVQISLAENSGREDMHPADQYEAFRRMIEDEGASLDAVAARFNVSTLTVRRRLKLAGVAPQLLELFRQGEISQEQLQVLALVPDQETQWHIWSSASSYQRSAYQLRAMVMARDVPASDPVARFVGVDAYVSAGGTLRADLFASPSGDDTFLCDPALLDRLASEKLEALAVSVRAEGWAWVAVHVSFNSHDELAYGRRKPTRREATKAEAKALQGLDLKRRECAEELDALYDQCDEDDADKVRALESQIEQLDDAIEAHNEKLNEFSASARAKSGVVLTINGNGEARCVRGLVQVEDAAKEKKDRQRALAQGVAQDDEGGGLDMPSRTSNGRVVREFPEGVMLDLTAHRTAAVQASMLAQPRVALAALVWRMAEAHFADYYNTSPLKIAVTSSAHVVSHAATGFAESRAGLALQEAEAQWRALIPFTAWEDKGKLFGWLLAQDDALLLRLLAFLTAQSVDLSTRNAKDASDAQGDHQLAAALGVDMADWWTAQVPNYFAHLPKQKAADAIAEACGAVAAAPLAKMKKGEAATAAETALAGKRWLPMPLRAGVAAAA